MSGVMAPSPGGTIQTTKLIVDTIARCFCTSKYHYYSCVKDNRLYVSWNVLNRPRSRVLLFSLYCRESSLTKRLELAFIGVLAWPKASRIAFTWKKKSQQKNLGHDPRLTNDLMKWSFLVWFLVSQHIQTSILNSFVWKIMEVDFIVKF